MKIERLTPILSLLLAAGTAPVQAAAPSYGSIQLCDGVNLADDHVGAWGCWNNLDPTAAGPDTGGGAFMALPSGSDYRQNPAFSQSTAFECPAGAACGYAVYWDRDTDGQSESTSQPLPAHLVATPGAVGEADGNGNVAMQVSIQLVPVNPDAPPPQVAQSGPITIAYNINSGSGHAILPKPYFIYGNVAGSDENGLSPLVSGPYLIGNYVAGTGTLGHYVIGTSTPSATTLAALADESRLSGKIATYTGREIINEANPVTISVNFGLASWNGSWGNGEAAWSATGTVTGGHIQSTGIGGSYDAGQVKGSFYGRNAEALAGVVDVYKAATPTIRHTDLFMADTKGLVSPSIVTPR